MDDVLYLFWDEGMDYGVWGRDGLGSLANLGDEVVW